MYNYKAQEEPNTPPIKNERGAIYIESASWGWKQTDKIWEFADMSLHLQDR